MSFGFVMSGGRNEPSVGNDASSDGLTSPVAIYQRLRDQLQVVRPYPNSNFLSGLIMSNDVDAAVGADENVSDTPEEH